MNTPCTNTFAASIFICAGLFALPGCTQQNAPTPTKTKTAAPLAPDTSGKYGRCVGNPEEAKCRAIVDALAAETSDAKTARIAKLERDRATSAAAVAKEPLTKQALQKSVALAPALGMTADEARDSTWGLPQTINRSTSDLGMREQWVYGDGNYLYFESGRLTNIQSRH